MNSGARPKARAVAPNRAGPITRMKLVTVRRRPSDSPVRPGADAANVPTVGTVVNFIYFGSSTLGISDSVTPIDTGEVRAFQLITPFGVIPLTPSTVPVGRPVVTYYDPFGGG